MLFGKNCGFECQAESKSFHKLHQTTVKDKKTTLKKLLGASIEQKTEGIYVILNKFERQIIALYNSILRNKRQKWHGPETCIFISISELMNLKSLENLENSAFINMMKINTGSVLF